MCIALISTAHPYYPLIIASNRDEYLSRPTAPASWWPDPEDRVLAGHDLHRSVQGTWLGITAQGRLAVLTNFRDDAEPVQGARSRGEIVRAFLTAGLEPHEDDSTQAFVTRLLEGGGEGVRGVGGFTLVCGRLRIPEESGKREALAVVSNRTPNVEGVTWIAGETGETHGLSNSAFGDRSWPKVVQGEEKMRELVKESDAKGETKDELVERLFALLSTDTLPQPGAGEDWHAYIRQLRNSIFVPRIGGEGEREKPADEMAAAKATEPVSVTSGVYGTTQQTVILVNWNGGVTFVEKTLNQDTKRSDGSGTSVRQFDFETEDWFMNISYS